VDCALDLATIVVELIKRDAGVDVGMEVLHLVNLEQVTYMNWTKDVKLALRKADFLP
jgi:hypothetical protein